MSFSPSLKSLPGFEGLTSAEAAVFERELVETSFQTGEAVRFDESLYVVRSGVIRVQVEATGPGITFALVGRGGLIGELTFFEPQPVPTRAEVESDAVCWAVDRRVLKNTFRYSRTGAVKFMVGFARSLSHKIRSANTALEKTVSSDPGDLHPAQLDPVDLQRLTSLATTRSYRAGDVIFRQGEAGRELFVIGSGEVEIIRSEASGGSMSLARLGPGEFFGEMAFVDERPRSADAVARSPLQVCVLPSGCLEKAAQYNVGMSLYLTSVICKIMARRLNVTLKRLVQQR